MDLRIFFKENNIQQDTVKYVASDRFKDENGNFVEWELKILKNKEVDLLKDKYTKKEIDKKGMTNISFDNKGFIREMLISCIKSPNLNDKALQDSYDVMDAYELLEEILTVGEFTALQGKVLELHDYSEKEKKVSEEIKN